MKSMRLPLAAIFLPPANEVYEGYVFTGVCLSTGGACMVAPGGHAWLLRGGMCGCSQGGHAWLLPGGRAWLLGGGMHGCSGGSMRGCSQGGCMVAPRGCAWLLRGMRGCSGGCAWLLRGCAWLLQGACVVAPGGACVVAPGGACVVAQGHAWLLPGGREWFFRGGVRGFFHEIRSMRGRYASYWNAFLFMTYFHRARGAMALGPPESTKVSNSLLRSLDVGTRPINAHYIYYSFGRPPPFLR